VRAQSLDEHAWCRTHEGRAPSTGAGPSPAPGAAGAGRAWAGGTAEDEESEGWSGSLGLECSAASSPALGGRPRGLARGALPDERPGDGCGDGNGTCGGGRWTRGDLQAAGPEADLGFPSHPQKALHPKCGQRAAAAVQPAPAVPPPPASPKGSLGSAASAASSSAAAAAKTPGRLGGQGGSIPLLLARALSAPKPAGGGRPKGAGRPASPGAQGQGKGGFRARMEGLFRTSSSGAALAVGPVAPGPAGAADRIRARRGSASCAADGSSSGGGVAASWQGSSLARSASSGFAALFSSKSCLKKKESATAPLQPRPLQQPASGAAPPQGLGGGLPAVEAAPGEAGQLRHAAGCCSGEAPDTLLRRARSAGREVEGAVVAWLAAAAAAAGGEPAGPASPGCGAQGGGGGGGHRRAVTWGCADDPLGASTTWGAPAVGEGALEALAGDGASTGEGAPRPAFPVDRFVSCIDTAEPGAADDGRSLWQAPHVGTGGGWNGPATGPEAAVLDMGGSALLLRRQESYYRQQAAAAAGVAPGSPTYVQQLQGIGGGATSPLRAPPAFYVAPILPPQSGLDPSTLASCQPSLCAWHQACGGGAATVTAAAAAVQRGPKGWSGDGGDVGVSLSGGLAGRAAGSSASGHARRSSASSGGSVTLRHECSGGARSGDGATPSVKGWP
jgi:hypothetical protein